MTDAREQAESFLLRLQAMKRQGVRKLPRGKKGSASRLADVAAEADKCTKCVLAEGRTKVVFGVGNENADLMFVGEGPGRDEDLSGEPFVGRAGQLLTKIIEAMEMTREGVYIANTVKCRPPNNRTPTPDEIATCNPFLTAQIERIQPKLLVALGLPAAKTLTGQDTSMAKMRGHLFPYQGIPVLPTYHPAYLLRNPPDKKKVWEDMQWAMRILSGEEVPTFA